MSMGYVLTVDPCCSVSSDNPSTINNEHTAVVDVFAGPGRFWHVAIGFLAGLLGSPLDMAVFAGFAGYQVSQAQTGEPWQATGGEFFEFGLGVVLAKVMESMA